MAKFLFSASPECCGGTDEVLYIPDDVLEEMTKDGSLNYFLYKIANDLFDICSDCVSWKRVEDNYGYNGLVSKERFENVSHYYALEKYFYMEGEGV